MHESDAESRAILEEELRRTREHLRRVLGRPPAPSADDLAALRQHFAKTDELVLRFQSLRRQAMDALSEGDASDNRS